MLVLHLMFINNQIVLKANKPLCCCPNVYHQQWYSNKRSKRYSVAM